VTEARWQSPRGDPIEPVAGYEVPPDAVLVLSMARRWAPRCSHCFAIVPPSRRHARGKLRRWEDLPWAGHRAVIEYASDRLGCARCGHHAVELVGWADTKQRQTRRLQHYLALDAFSMPLSHVATKYGLSWHTVRRAEADALARWERTRPPKALKLVGVDEKWLGRRHKRKEKFVTIVSDLDSGEPVWIGYNRSAATLEKWLATLTSEQKTAIVLVACDMHEPFKKAIRENEGLGHVAIVHDPFHVMKRAVEAVTELRREIFFRAGPELRAVGRGTRWLVMRAWERTNDEDKTRLRALFAVNGKLARAYQIVEELREVLKAPDAFSMMKGLAHILQRTEKRTNVPLRKLHDSLLAHYNEIIALGEHRPPTGRIEALNGNWETLVRRGRGYRNHEYILRKLRFLTANPVRNRNGILRFLALGLPAPTHAAAA
jgi:transposase